MSNTTDKMLDRYVYLHVDEMTIHVKLDDEGVAVDVWKADDSFYGDSVIASTWKTYNDMGVEVKGIKDE